MKRSDVRRSFRERKWFNVPWKRVSISRLLLYSAFVALPLFLEKAPEVFNLSPDGQESSILSAPVYLYQWIVTFGPRKPRAHFVRLVLIDRKTEPDDITSETSPCAQRTFMARLLPALAAAQPAVIGIDKYYPPDTCTAKQSAGLVSAVKDVAQKVPIVLLNDDAGPSELESSPPEKLKALEKKGAVVSFPTLDLSPNVTYGLKTLNADERKIPLHWPVISSRDFDRQSASELAHHKAERKDTLTVAVVRQYDPGALTGDAIQWFEDRNTHPFTSFLEESKIPTYSPIDLICGKNQARNIDWRKACLEPNPRYDGLKQLRNRVVIVGQNSSQDIHHTVIGRIPGVVLQANYIESLLDDRYLKPSPWEAELVFSALGLLILEWVFVRLEDNPPAALLTYGGAVALLWFLCSDFVILQLGWYLVAWLPSALGVTARTLELLATKARPKKQPQSISPATLHNALKPGS